MNNPVYGEVFFLCVYVKVNGESPNGLPPSSRGSKSRFLFCASQDTGIFQAGSQTVASVGGASAFKGQRCFQRAGSSSGAAAPQRLLQPRWVPRSPPRHRDGTRAQNGDGCPPEHRRAQGCPGTLFAPQPHKSEKSEWGDTVVSKPGWFWPQTAAGAGGAGAHWLCPEGGGRTTRHARPGRCPHTRPGEVVAFSQERARSRVGLGEEPGGVG